MTTNAPETLIQMSRALGQPERRYVIIGEGNTSLRADDETFWVKSSGYQLATISEEGFARIQFAPIMHMFDDPPANLTEEREILRSARADGGKAYPSVETSFHAMLLQDCGVQCIAHTHPIPINRLMCSAHAETFAKRRTCPDEAIVCGPESVFVPYIDPGLPLAIEIRRRVHLYIEKHGEAPKVILLANHGLIALAQSPTEALNITDMAIKGAEILWGALAIGEPVFLSEAEVTHLCKRPDEIYRRKLWFNTASTKGSET